jgi:hypothetical protein
MLEASLHHYHYLDLWHVRCLSFEHKKEIGRRERWKVKESIVYRVGNKMKVRAKTKILSISSVESGATVENYCRQTSLAYCASSATKKKTF